RGGVLVAAVSLEHGALAVVSHGLGFALVVVQRTRGAIAAVEAVSENIDGGEPFAAGVVIPYVVDRPQMILGDKTLKGFARWNRGPWAGLGVIAVGAAGFGVGEPIHRRNILVRTGHLY